MLDRLCRLRCSGCTHPLLTPLSAALSAVLPAIAFALLLALWPVAAEAHNLDGSSTLFPSNSATSGSPNIIDQAGLTVSKVANVSEAVAGDTITYTYQITNTGNVPLTITASDDQLGNVAGLAGALAPLATRTASLPYVVQESDPVGPLVNTVTVTGTVVDGAPLVVTDTASVNIGSPTGLPEEEQPTQRREIFLPSVEN